MEKSKITTKTIIIYVSAFVTGAIILTLEILGTRIVAPYYGSTIFVWSALIGVTMIGLAIGYFAGGWLSDRKPETYVLSIIVNCSAILVFIIRFVSRPVLLATDFFGAFFGPLASASILFILPMILLGMVSPFYVKLVVNELKSTGRGAGSLYGVSTVGSVLGALLSGFVFIPVFGITALLDIICVTLALMAIVVTFAVKSRSRMVAVSILMGAAVIIAILVANAIPQGEKTATPADRTRLLTDRQSLYSRIRVFDYSNRFRALLVEGAIQTMYDTALKKSPSKYLEYFYDASKIRGNAKNALVIGLGGGGLDSMFAGSGVNVTNVEIDPEMRDIAEEYFDFKGRTVIDDGRHFLRYAKESYDLVYLDAFSGFSICPYLLTREAFENVRDRLSENGILCINSIGRLKRTDSGLETDESLTPAIRKTLLEVFDYVESRASDGGIANIVTYASNSPMEIKTDALDFEVPDTGYVLTDDSNRVELFVTDLIAEWREEMKASLANVFPL